VVADNRPDGQAGALPRGRGAHPVRGAWLPTPPARPGPRDYCPLFVRGPDTQMGLVGWRFTGWAKYSTHRRDAAVPSALARRLSLRFWQPQWGADGGQRRIVLEGGAIDGNGHGSLLTTQACP